MSLVSQLAQGYARRLYSEMRYPLALTVRRLRDRAVRPALAMRNWRAYGTTDMFNALNIETTTYCNRRCSYCPNAISTRGLKEHERRMSQSTFQKIVGELKAIDYCGRISPHHYGEPLLDERLPDFMDYAHRRLPKAKLVIFTNGDHLDEALLVRLYHAGVRRYVVTLHGTTAGKVSGRRSIELVRHYIGRHGLAVSVDVKEFTSESFLSTRGGLVRVRRAAQDCSCQYASNPLVIDHRGDVLLCCNDYSGQVVFGNMEQERLMDIWRKPEFSKIRAELKRRTYSLDLCIKCAGSRHKGTQALLANSDH